MATLSAVLVTSMGVLLGAGAGVVEGATADAARVERQEAVPLCTAAYVIDYYNSQTYVDRVGEDFCDCGLPLMRWGRVTPHGLVLYWEPCETGVENSSSMGE